MQQKILLVEDEVQVVSFITKGLMENNYDVTIALNGEMAMDIFEKNQKFDLIILDIMLPDTNGIEICKKIRKVNLNVPILFLTALGTTENIVYGLESGADDYLVKPFKFIELLARIKNLLKRSQVFGEKNLESNIFQIDNLVMDDDAKRVTRNDIAITLTSTEYRLLHFFMQNVNRVVSRMEILEHVWGVNFDMSTNVVDVYVNYLRKKIEFPEERKLIHTIIGMGYCLKLES
jgi:two-component system copper resistance phosphate regulon response regulator CusR